MAPRPNRDGYRAYADLRALMTELLKAPDPTERDEALIAIRIWLRTHCEGCGAVVSRNVHRPEDLNPTCWDCDITDLQDDD